MSRTTSGSDRSLPARVLGSRVTRRGLLALGLVLMILIAWCVPFSMGSAVTSHGPSGSAMIDPRATPGRLVTWRLEHGRFTLRWRRIGWLGFTPRKPFFIASNTQGMRWAPSARWESPCDWHLTIPLWMPMALVLVLAGWSGGIPLRGKDRSGGSGSLL